jgi:hypothetical protein
MFFFYLENLKKSSIKRKQQIKELFEKFPDGMIAINSKWQIQIKNDKDLKSLIKENYLKQIRINHCLSDKGGLKKTGKRQTCLVLNK